MATKFAKTLASVRQYGRKGDPYCRISAAVLIRAIRDLEKPWVSSKCCADLTLAHQEALTTQDARRFLQTRMYPWCEVLGLDPRYNEAFRQFLRDNGMKPLDSREDPLPEDD